MDDGNGDDGAELFIVVPVVIAVVIGCLTCCCRKERTSRPNNNPPAVNMFAAGEPQPPPLPTHVGQDDDDEMAADLRKAIIESALITRKVVSADDNSSSSGRFGRMMDSLRSSDRTYSSFVAAFSKMGRSNRSVEFSDPSVSPDLSVPQGNDEDEQEKPAGHGDEEEKEQNASNHSARGDKPRRKCNIVARAISTSLRSSEAYEHPTTCDICLMDYEVGEEVSWSPNDECVHVYHKECIADWLMNSDNCPVCRRNYLNNDDSP